MKKQIERLTGDTIKKLGSGSYSTAFRSLTDPTIVYIASIDYDNVKELMSRVNTIHAPKIEYIDDFTYYSRFDGNRYYKLYKTEYTECPKKKHGRAYEQWQILQAQWDLIDGRFRRLDKNNWHQVVYDFIDILRENELIEDSIIDTLDLIYMRSTDYDTSFKFEFPRCNVGVDSTGNLILRDIVFFR